MIQQPVVRPGHQELVLIVSRDDSSKCASKSLTAGPLKGKSSVAFANFYGVNTHPVANFNLPA